MKDQSNFLYLIILFYSHELFLCVYMDSIRRKLIMVTIGTLRGNSDAQY